MKTSLSAFVTIGLTVTGLIAACGGAEEKDVLNATPGQTTATSTSGGGNGSTSGGGTSTSSSTGGTSTSSSTSSSSGSTSSSSSSGNPCAPCPSPAPEGCTFPDPCSCKYECPTGPVKCVWSAAANTCPDGYYCEAPNCQQGVCVQKGATENPNNRDPQCGCNGVTYWNTSVAHKAGVPVRKNGICNNDVARCGGIAPVQCPAGSTCNIQVAKKSECGQSDGAGACWGMPEKCPTVVIGGRAHACGPVGACGDECTAIRKGTVWYDDQTCPQ